MKTSVVFVCFFFIALTSASCPFNSVEWQGSCYFFPDYQFDVETAEQFCVDWQGHLASIHDSFLNDFLKQTAEQQISNSSTFWLGLQHFAEEYYWLDGSDLDYTNWSSGQPVTQNSNDEAIFDIYTGLWKTADVSTHLSFVCKIDLLSKAQYISFMNYFIILILFHHIVGFLASLGLLIFSTYILFYRRFYKRLSFNMSFYFVYTLTSSIAALFYHIYVLALWRPEAILFDARTLFIIGVISFILTFLYALVECFICLDRCLSVIFPTAYSKFYQITFMLIGIGFMAFTAYLFYATTSPFYPTSSETACLFFACMVAKSSYLLIKGITVVAGFTSSLILAYLIKRKFNSANKTATRINRTVVVNIILTTVSEVIPFVVAEIFYSITNVSIALYAGPFIYTISLVTGAIIAGKYCKTFVKVFGVSNSVNTYFS